MPRAIAAGEWRILHGEWRDAGASLTIIATRESPRRFWRPDVTKLSRILLCRIRRAAGRRVVRL
ncbi:MAG TPA: hypothetical protein VGJ18_15145 [Gemmatimonadaceae bacterium]